MARYIDVDKLLKEVDNLKMKGYLLVSLLEIEGKIENQPTLDVMPIEHGEWVKTNNVVYTAHGKYDVCECSFCKNDVTIADFDNYCPCCGARMWKEV